MSDVFRFLKFSGRMRVLPFWGWWLGAWLLLGVLTAGGIMLVPGGGAQAIFIVALIVATYIQLAAFVARLKDTGREAWKWILLFVPLFGFIYLILVGVDPSEAE